MNTKKFIKLAVLAALSIVLALIIRFPIIPAAPWLLYEPADVPILISAFMYGPIAGLIVTIVVSVIQGLTVSADGGLVGIVMHVIASGTLALVAGFIYKKMHTRKGAVIALLSGTIAMALIMIPANLFFTTRYWGIPFEGVVAMILPIIIPFNLIKAGINSAITFIIYKRIHRFIEKQ